MFEGGTLNITGDAGYRLLSTPVITSYSDILDEIWTQGASTGADVTNGTPNVFTWSKTWTNGDNTNCYLVLLIWMIHQQLEKDF